MKENDFENHAPTSILVRNFFGKKYRQQIKWKLRQLAVQGYTPVLLNPPAERSQIQT